MTIFLNLLLSALPAIGVFISIRWLGEFWVVGAEAYDDTE